MLLRFAAVQKMFPAPKRNIKNIESWIETNRGALAANEASFISHCDELVSISEPKAALLQWFEDNIIYSTRQSLKLFHKPLEKTELSLRDQQSMYIVNESTFHAFGSFAVFAAATVMLIVPLWVLQSLKSLHSRLAVITAFLFVCLLFLSFATLGRTFERL